MKDQICSSFWKKRKRGRGRKEEKEEKEESKKRNLKKEEKSSTKRLRGTVSDKTIYLKQFCEKFLFFGFFVLFCFFDLV